MTTPRTTRERSAWPGEEHYAGALAALPMQTHRRVRRLIMLGPPSHTWHDVRRGARPLRGIDDSVWRAWMSPTVASPSQIGERCAASGIDIVVLGDRRFPAALVGDPAGPAVLFVRGDTSHLSRRRVGVVGTRTATAGARRFARELGRALADHGVCVVSGLARGIDVESHAGALAAESRGAAGPAAVVASGPDVVYPREHAGIWGDVCARGVLISEFAPGVQPEPHRFPLRNRILASLSEVLVVVESRRTGGSMTTVREAMKRDITVMAVPGSPSNHASEGTNELLRDGCAPVTGAEDVLMALGLDTRRAGSWCDARTPPEGDEQNVMIALSNGPRTIEEVAIASSLSVLRTAVLLGRLESKGWVAHAQGWWEALTR